LEITFILHPLWGGLGQAFYSSTANPNFDLHFRVIFRPYYFYLFKMVFTIFFWRIHSFLRKEEEKEYKMDDNDFFEMD